MLTTAFGSMMVDQLVDAKVNPTGFLEFIAENKSFTGRSPMDFVVSSGFATPIRFHVEMKHPDTGSEFIATAILQFFGASCRVTKVILPITAIVDGVAKHKRPQKEDANPARAWAPGPGGVTPFYLPGISRPLFQ